MGLPKGASLRARDNNDYYSSLLPLNGPLLRNLSSSRSPTRRAHAAAESGCGRPLTSTFPARPGWPGECGNHAGGHHGLAGEEALHHQWVARSPNNYTRRKWVHSPGGMMGRPLLGAAESAGDAPGGGRPRRGHSRGLQQSWDARGRGLMVGGMAAAMAADQRAATAPVAPREIM